MTIQKLITSKTLEMEKRYMIYSTRTSHGLPESSGYRKRGLFVISEFFRIVTSRPGLTPDTKIFWLKIMFV